MAIELRLRRGTTAEHSAFTGAGGEVTVNTSLNSIVVHDGVTPGGHPVAGSGELSAHIANTSNPHSVTKAQVGLGNVDNTSDANKPISTATQAALNAHTTNTSNPHSVTKAQVGLGNVDNTSDANKPVSTATQAALDAHTTDTSNPHSVTKAQVGLGNVDNTSDASKPISTATQTALDAKVTASTGPGGAAYSFRNKFINGGFGLWQRGSSFTVAAGSIVYTADRWGVSVAGSSVTCQLVDYGTDTGLVLTGAAGNTKTVVRQRIEAQNARPIAGKTVTLSFLGYHSDAMSISWEVNRANSADSFATVTGVASGSVAIPSGEFAYRTVSFSLPADAKNGIEVLLYVDGLLAGKQLAFRRMQLEEGAVATPFEDRPRGLELALCQRYFEKSFPMGVAPQSSAGGGSALPAGGGTASMFEVSTIAYAVTKRDTPTITTYNPSVAGSSWRNGMNSLDSPATVINNGPTRLSIATNSGNAQASNTVWYIHWTADAEL